MELLNNNHSFNLKQREMFAKLLAQAKEHIQGEIESDYSANQRIETEMLPKLAEEYGATKLIETVRKLQKEFEDAESALRKLGFSCTKDAISIEYETAPKALDQAVEAAQRSAKQERDKVLKKYDRAILGVWASEDATEAKKIVEELL